MLKYVQAERRDYLPVFDVVVQDISDQSSMKLKADIKYKSNWQQGALKSEFQRVIPCQHPNQFQSTQPSAGTNGFVH